MNTYGYTILYVENVEATLAFYVKAFGFAQKFITPEKDYGELETGGTTLAWRGNWWAQRGARIVNLFWNQKFDLLSSESFFVANVATYIFVMLGCQSLNRF